MASCEEGRIDDCNDPFRKRLRRGLKKTKKSGCVSGRFAYDAPPVQDGSAAFEAFLRMPVADEARR